MLRSRPTSIATCAPPSRSRFEDVSPSKSSAAGLVMVAGGLAALAKPHCLWRCRCWRGRRRRCHRRRRRRPVSSCRCRLAALVSLRRCRRRRRGRSSSVRGWWLGRSVALSSFPPPLCSPLSLFHIVLEGFVAMAHLRHGARWVPLCLGVSASVSVFLTQKNIPYHRTPRQSQRTLRHRDIASVSAMLLLTFFVLFTCQFTVPKEGLLHIFCLGTSTA